MKYRIRRTLDATITVEYEIEANSPEHAKGILSEGNWPEPKIIWEKDRFGSYFIDRGTVQWYEPVEVKDG